MKKIVLILNLVSFFVINSNAQSNISWSTSGQDISNNSFGNLHPRIAKDRAGNPLVVWGRMSDKAVMFSRWNGASFTSPVRLNPTGLDVATASWMGPDIASHGDTIYVIIKRSPEVSDTNYIYLIRSFDGGQNFLAPVRVDAIADSISRFPTLTTDALGNPLVAFMKFNSSLVESRWVVTKSTDFGSTFSTDVLASSWGGSTEVCDCCPGSIVSDGNNSAVLYRDNNSNIRDTWMGVSTNNGSTYSSGCNIENNNWMLMACPSSGPDGIIVGDTLHSVFMNGVGGDYLIYYSKSSLSNTSLGSVVDLAGNISGLTQQNYPRIEKNGNAVGIVWKQVVNGNTELALLFTNNISQGFPSFNDAVDLGDVTNTDLLINDDKIFVIWQDDNSGTVKYRMGSYIANTNYLEKKELDETLKVYPNPSEMFWNISGVWENEAISIRIIDVLGKEKFFKKYYNLNNKSELSISNENFETGVYIMEISSKFGLKTIEIVKNK